MTGMSYVTCSWCHRVCAAKDTECPTCGHNPSVPQSACDCKTCRLSTGRPPWGVLETGLLGDIAEDGLFGDLGQGGLLGDLFTPQSDERKP